jgi:ssDNA-binding Zn-finger/Zn-ribbon topoisomerase 1
MSEFDFKIERYEEYYGDAKQVKKILNDCKICGAKLIHSHLSDYKNLIVQETCRCPECGGDTRKKIHIIS